MPAKRRVALPEPSRPVIVRATRFLPSIVAGSYEIPVSAATPHAAAILPKSWVIRTDADEAAPDGWSTR